MMARKHRLGDTPADYCVLFGIVSALPDYRMAHYLNEKLSLHLKRINDLPVQHSRDGDDDFHTTFYSPGEERLSHFYLFLNKGLKNKVPLFPSLKNIDYVLMMVDESDERLDIRKFPKTIREIQGVILAQQVDLKKVPNADMVMNLAELHMIDLSKK